MPAYLDRRIRRHEKGISQSKAADIQQNLQSVLCAPVLSSTVIRKLAESYLQSCCPLLKLSSMPKVSMQSRQNLLDN
ncbi:hypothetical protein CEXT_572511 [Caerostris extrusa]|uniref:Uncharacterized protein n=1 Tax=Caerostris extrusa TaxID=172846 RepID=A0AAV4VFV8_CAEEX|nr:hypothetical protein CEXT_572511 [Caerostris extrusa]